MKLLKLSHFIKKALSSKLPPYFTSLPVFCKKFLSNNKILYRFQSGIQKNHSTNTCLGHLTDKITTGFEKGIFTGMVLIDLLKAFDTIDLQISLKKMKYLDFSKNTIAWFKHGFICDIVNWSEENLDWNTREWN